MNATERETQTWYQVDRMGSYRIRPREVVKVTAKQVVYLEPNWREGCAPTERRSARES